MRGDDHESAGQHEESDQIITMGEFFQDGSAIDRLQGNRLVLWHQGCRQIGRTVTYNGRIYAPANLDSHLEQVLRLPADIKDFGTTEDLIAELGNDAIIYGGLDQNVALLAAVSIMGTWVAECLPGSLLINPWGATGSQTALLDLMACVCRRAVRLAEPSVSELAKLQNGLAPTIVLGELSDRALRRLVAAGEPDTYVLAGGRIAQIRCPIVARTSEPVSIPAVAIPLLPVTGSYSRITGADAQDLRNRYQPRLLAWRLAQHRTIANSQFDVVRFCPETRVLARVLGAIVEGANAVQSRIVDVLACLDEQCKAEHSQAPAAAVLETLLASCHRKAPAIFVGETADMANGFLASRSETMELSAKAVGAIFRRLGLLVHRHSSGYELALNQNTQRRVHRLAHTHGLFSLFEPIADCTFCREVLETSSTVALR